MFQLEVVLAVDEAIHQKLTYYYIVLSMMQTVIRTMY